MFDLFKKDKNRINITDRIWLSEANKLKACAMQVKNDGGVFIVAWFDETITKLESYFSELHLPLTTIVAARELARHHLNNNRLIFAEHYPLLKKEMELYQKLSLSNVVVYSSLDEPLLTHFSGDKLLTLMKKMGMKEDESLENPTISSALKKAQEKIENTLTVERTAHSPSEWFAKNFKGA